MPNKSKCQLLCLVCPSHFLDQSCIGTTPSTLYVHSSFTSRPFYLTKQCTDPEIRCHMPCPILSGSSLIPSATNAYSCSHISHCHLYFQFPNTSFQHSSRLPTQRIPSSGVMSENKTAQNVEPPSLPVTCSTAINSDVGPQTPAAPPPHMLALVIKYLACRSGFEDPGNIWSQRMWGNGSSDLQTYRGKLVTSDLNVLGMRGGGAAGVCCVHVTVNCSGTCHWK